LPKYDSSSAYVDPATRTSTDRALAKPDTMPMKSIDATTIMVSRAAILSTALQTMTGASRSTTTMNAINPRVVLLMTVLSVMCTCGSLEILLNGDSCRAVHQHWTLSWYLGIDAGTDTLRNLFHSWIRFTSTHDSSRVSASSLEEVIPTRSLSRERYAVSARDIQALPSNQLRRLEIA